MPNWCMNTLTVTGPREELQRFLEFGKGPADEAGGQRILDANKFIPMPESLTKVESGSKDILYDIWYGNIDRVKDYQWIPEELKGDREKLKEFFRKDKDRGDEDADALADQYKFNVDNYGCKTWYDWAIRNWGSKWNFSEPHLISENGNDLTDHPNDFASSLIYSFDTAWSPMIPVITRMGELFPQLRFVLDYAEPGCDFQGTYAMENGLNILDDCHEYIPSEDEEAWLEGDVPEIETPISETRYEQLGKERRRAPSTMGTKDGIVEVG
jgi:hypothetical protein